MKKDLFTDGISHIDVDAVERLLQIEQNMQAKKKRQRYSAAFDTHDVIEIFQTDFLVLFFKFLSYSVIKAKSSKSNPKVTWFCCPGSSHTLSNPRRRFTKGVMRQYSSVT